MRRPATMVDYMEWRGDLGFDAVPFNDVDNIVLAVLSYLDFTGIVPTEEEGGCIRLSDACGLLQEKIDGDITPYVRSLAHVGSDYLTALMATRRFGDATLSAYSDRLDHESAVQFAAVTIDLPDGPMYVSFRGTDSTLVGWREDFCLGFRLTEAQGLALGYLERAVTRRCDRQFVVGGHSKGGVLAEYASACCDGQVRNRIAHVYNNDGPGIDPQVVPLDLRAILGNRLTLVVPTYSVVGMLYAKGTDRRIVVASNERGASQHDPTSWLVTPTGLQVAEGLLPECKAVNAGVATWAAGVPLDERERIVNEVFDALGAGGAQTLREVASTPGSLQKVLDALDDCDPRTKVAARQLIDSIVASSMDAATQSAKEKAERWKQNAREMFGASARKLAGTNGRKGDESKNTKKSPPESLSLS